MFCRNCAKEVNEAAVVCVGCGLPPGVGTRHCWNCGAETGAGAEVCIRCGVALVRKLAPDANAKSKLAAGLLGVFLGGLGIHRFYLGYTGIAVAQLVLGLAGIFTCGITSIASAIWGLIEGILVLTGSIDKDAQGKPLRE